MHSLIALITAAVLLAPLTSLKAGHHELVIQGGSVIDTRTGKALENQTVVIEGDRITRVAPAKEVAVPSDARVVDARGRWIVPGLLTCTCTEPVNLIWCRSPSMWQMA
jgi:N-acyl-D-aspartate/D-glutamate deacylase